MSHVANAQSDRLCAHYVVREADPGWPYFGHLFSQLFRCLALVLLSNSTLKKPCAVIPKGGSGYRTYIMYHPYPSSHFSDPPITNATPRIRGIYLVNTPKCDLGHPKWSCDPLPIVQSKRRTSRSSLGSRYSPSRQSVPVQPKCEARQPEERTVLRIRHPEELRVRHRTAREAYANLRSVDAPR